jgi:ArsR family metal-binding transcriptional regulator
MCDPELEKIKSESTNDEIMEQLCNRIKEAFDSPSFNQPAEKQRVAERVIACVIDKTSVFKGNILVIPPW